VLGGLLRRLLPAAAGDNSGASLTEALPWLWAVAARTRYPEVVFEELRSLADYPGVAASWQPGWRFEPVTYVHQQRWNKEQPTRTETWTELHVPTEHQGQQPPSPLLVYSLHARLRQDGSRYLWSLVGGINFLLSLLPANPAPLHWHLVRTLYHTNHTYGEERSVQQQVLHTLLLPGPAFAEPTTLLLAIALLQSVAAGRALALEVLLGAPRPRASPGPAARCRLCPRAPPHRRPGPGPWPRRPHRRCPGPTARNATARIARHPAPPNG
jgi:hypothetical protein